MALGRGAFVSPIGNALFPDQTNQAFDYLKNTLVGKPASYEKEPSRFDPEQQGILRNLLQQGSQGLGTDAIEGNARRGFQNSTIPLLSERFANIGQRGLSGIGSSGYQNELQDAGTTLESNLAELRQRNSMNLLNLGLQDQQDYRFVPESPGVLPGILDSLIRAGTAYATGGGSEAGNIMDLFRSQFNGGQGAEAQGGNFGIQGGSTQPFKKLLSQQSGHQLLNQNTQNQLGLPGIGQQPDYFQSRNMLQQGGQANIMNLLKQSLANRLSPNLNQSQSGNGDLLSSFLFGNNRQPYVL